MASGRYRYRSVLAVAAVAAASVVGLVTSVQPPAGATDPPNEPVERISGNWAAQGDSRSLSLSDDGNVVAFTSQALDLVEDPHSSESGGYYLYDRRTQTTQQIGDSGGELGGVALDGDGSTAVMWVRHAFQYNLEILDRTDYSQTYTDADGNGTTPAFTADISPDARWLTWVENRRVWLQDRANPAAPVTIPVSTAALTEWASMWPQVSADGRYVAFFSDAALVAGDTNGFRDAYLYDRVANTTTRVSVSTGGAQANADVGNSFITIQSGPSVTVESDGSGARVAFSTAATNLTADPTSAGRNVFVRDVDDATTTMVSPPGPGPTPQYDGGIHPVLQAGGNAVVYLALGANGLEGTVWVRRDLGSSASTVIAQDIIPGAIFATRPVGLSTDGSFAAFAMSHSGLPDDTDEFMDIVGVDIATQELWRLSPSLGSDPVAPDSAPGFGIATSANGRFVSWSGMSGDVYFADRERRTKRVLVAPFGFFQFGSTAMSDDGRYVVFSSTSSALVPGDTNNARDVFRVDTTTGAVERVDPPAHFTTAGDPTATPDVDVNAAGNLVAFRGTPLGGEAGVFMRDMSAPGDTATRVDLTSTGSTPPSSTPGDVSISDDGRYVAFATDAQLAPTDTGPGRDVYVRDRVANTTTMQDVTPAGVEGNGDSGAPTLSGDGAVVAFIATSTNLIPSTAGQPQTSRLFVREQATGVFRTISGLDLAGYAALSRDGRLLAGAENVGGIARTVWDTLTGSALFRRTYSESSSLNYFSRPGFTASGDGIAFPTDHAYVSTDGDEVASVYFTRLEGLADDADGVASVEEDGAPNGGDANSDGTADSEQGNVASFRSNGAGSPYTTIEAPAGTLLNNVGVAPVVAVPGSPALPLGAFYYELGGVTPGSTVTLRYLMPSGTGVDTLLRYSRSGGALFDFSWDGTTGYRVQGDEILMSITDGGRGEDPALTAADGVIVDPSMPADTVAEPSGDHVSVSLGGAFGGLTVDGDIAGTVTVAKDGYGVVTASASGTVGAATVAVDVKRFWVLPVHLGSVKVLDGGAGLNYSGFVIGKVTSSSPGVATGSTFFGGDLTRWPWRVGNAAFTLTDVA